MVCDGRDRGDGRQPREDLPPHGARAVHAERAGPHHRGGWVTVPDRAAPSERPSREGRLMAKRKRPTSTKKQTAAAIIKLYNKGATNKYGTAGYAKDFAQ